MTLYQPLLKTLINKIKVLIINQMKIYNDVYLI